MVLADENQGRSVLPLFLPFPPLPSILQKGPGTFASYWRGTPPFSPPLFPMLGSLLATFVR